MHIVCTKIKTRQLLDGRDGHDGWRSSRYKALCFLEGDLKGPSTNLVSVEGRYGEQGLVIVGHCYEPKPLALLTGQVAHDLDILDCSEGTKELPEKTLVCFRGQVVDKQAPPGSRQ